MLRPEKLLSLLSLAALATLALPTSARVPAAWRDRRRRGLLSAFAFGYVCFLPFIVSGDFAAFSLQPAFRCGELAFAQLSPLPPPTPVPAASSAAPEWGDVELLWESRSVSTYPMAAADPYGRVHVVWQESVNRPDGSGTNVGNVIYHRSWSGKSWTPAQIIVRLPRDSTSITHATLLASPGGKLYLTWLDRNGVYFTSAAAVGAAEEDAWRAPRRIATTPLTLDLDVALVGEDDLYVAFTDIVPQGDTAPLLFTRSRDGGETWSAVQAVIDWSPGQRSVAAQPALAVDAQGGVHVLWDERSEPSWLGDRILYSHSPPDSERWSEPLLLDDVSGREAEFRVTIASLAATPDGALHATWACGRPAGRCYRRRPAGSDDWAPIERPFGDLVSVAGWDNLLVDAAGDLHFIAQLRAPVGIYYATRKMAGKWSEPLLLDPTDSGIDPHFPNAELAYGNRIFAVWQRESQKGDVAFASLRTSAAALPTLAAPPPGARSEARSLPRLSWILSGLAICASLLWWRRRRARR